MVAIAEVKSVMPQAHPHHGDDHGSHGHHGHHAH
jgi:hypothetical protein